MVEILATEITGDHIGKYASLSWRGVWMKPLRIKTFESVTHADGRMIQRTVRFEGGTSYTFDPNIMKARIYQ